MVDVSSLPALGVQSPQINTMQNYLGAQKQQSDLKSAAINQAGAQQQQEAAALQQVAEMGLGVMNGKPDGQVDPVKFKQMMALLPQDSPLTAQLKDHPEMLPVITQGSMKVLQYAQDAQKFDLAKQQFGLDLQTAQEKLTEAKNAPPATDTQFDSDTGLSQKVQWDAATKSWTPMGGVQAPPAASGTLGEYQTYVDQTKALGQTPMGILDYQQALKGNGITLTNPDGTTIQIGGNGKGLTAEASKDVVFVTRASGALDTVNKLGDKLTSFGEDAAGKVPYGKYLQSDEYQKAKQAGDEFISAILRKDSGAAITPDERASYGDVYLPQPGDKPGVLKQKEAARNRAVKAIAMGLPPAAILDLENNDVKVPDLPKDNTVPDKASDPAALSDDDLLKQLNLN